eukprot:403332801
MGNCISQKSKNQSKQNKSLSKADKYRSNEVDFNHISNSEQEENKRNPKSILKSSSEVGRKPSSRQSGGRFQSAALENRSDDLYVIQEVSEPSNLASTVYINNHYNTRNQINSNNMRQNSNSQALDSQLNAGQIRNSSFASHNLRSNESRNDVVPPNMIYLDSVSDEEYDRNDLDEGSANQGIVDNEFDIDIPDENTTQIRCPLCNNLVNVDNIQSDGMRWLKQISKDGRIDWLKKKSNFKQFSVSNINLMPLAKAKTLPIEEKKVWFDNKCQERRISFLQDSITLVIQRDHILRDSFEQFRTTDDFDLHKEIKIHYVDEVALDAGGIMREWITELTKSLFSENKGLFKQCKSQQGITYFPNSKAKYIYDRQEYQDYFRFAGQVLAKALFDKIPVLINLNPLIYKKLVGINQEQKHFTFEHLKEYDQQIYNSIKFMAQNDSINYEEEEFYFTIMKDDGEEVELIKDGKNIKLSKENRQQFANKVAEYYLSKDVETEMNEFLKGFYQVIPHNLIQVFDNDEVEFIMNGVPSIDVNDWKSHTEYKGQFEQKAGNHQVVKWFWEILEKLTQEQIRKFLLFCTGSPTVPIEGFRGLQSNRNRVCLFQLQSVPFTDHRYSLIKAHTCFNRLDIPLFKKKEDLYNNIIGILSQEQYFFDFE